MIASYYYLRVGVKGGRVYGECECMWEGRGGVYGGGVGGRNSNTKQVNYLAYTIVIPLL